MTTVSTQSSQGSRAPDSGAQGSRVQDKSKEVAFFDSHAAVDAYDVFTPESNARLLGAIARLGKLKAGESVADLGCGSGVFTNLLRQHGYIATGLDLSPRLIERARGTFPDIPFVEGDVEHLPFSDASLDAVLFSGILHHLPDASRCAAEAFRVLRPGGRFVAFDPNRMNPFMWAYRDRSSPFYSSVGVSQNERPLLAREVAATFTQAGFRVGTEFLSGLHYRYVASSSVRWLLPVYNALDSVLFRPSFMGPFRSFVMTFGEKP
jgi:ubiquinone/menaquinone biosynthesis C-methylase UbiE